MKKAMLGFTILLFACSQAWADEGVFFTVSKRAGYDQALNDMTEAIQYHNYTLIKIQPVDEGLRSRGYRSLDYKVLFFGSQQQVNSILADNPQASVLLPMRIILYRKGNKVIASTPNMRMWKSVFGKKLQPMLDRWDKDVRAIMTDFVTF